MCGLEPFIPLLGFLEGKVQPEDQVISVLGPTVAEGRTDLVEHSLYMGGVPSSG